ncbi:MAG: RNA polymerase sigma factor region1.1 domain-containing protein, partial [Bacteriovoracales bacterium]
MSIVDSLLNSKAFEKLISKGKEQNFLTPEEINDAIPANIVDAKIIDDIMNRLKIFAIPVAVEAEEEEVDAGIKLDGTEIIEETLSKEERAELKSSSTDPVKLYLKRMGSVPLLTREGEVVIAKEIEEGEREI